MTASFACHGVTGLYAIHFAGMRIERFTSLWRGSRTIPVQDDSLYAIHSAWRAIWLFHFHVGWFPYSPCTG